MTDEELDEALTELEDTRQTAENELRALRGRQEAIIERLGRDKDALLEFYARMVPEELDRLDPAERHQVYKMLRLKVVIYPDASLEVTGVLRDCFARENQDERLSARQRGSSTPGR
jgi:sugar-specific transcriptional regulator TrmB